MALSPGKTGLEAYKIILKDLKKHLVCGGYALFEIGAGQEKDVVRLVDDSGLYVGDSYADLGGILRVVEMYCGENKNILIHPIDQNRSARVRSY
jgi:release factor glutamine methyltransferase